MMNDHTLYEDHLHKCRICFRELDSKVKTIKIDESIQETFQQFTGIELKISEYYYSSVVCSMCNYEIKRCQKFRKTITERQERLYILYRIPDDDKISEQPVPIVKGKEFNSFIDELTKIEIDENIITDPTTLPPPPIVHNKHVALTRSPKRFKPRAKRVGQFEPSSFAVSRTRTFPEEVTVKEEDIKRENKNLIQTVFIESRIDHSALELKCEDVEPAESCVRVSQLDNPTPCTSFRISRVVSQAHSPFVRLKSNTVKRIREKSRKLPTVSFNFQVSLSSSNFQ